MTDRAREPLLVVGGGPAGYATVAGYRAAGGAAQVVLVTDEAVLPYQRPPLSKEVLRGEGGLEDLPIADGPWYVQHEVDVHRGASVVDLDPVARTATLGDGTVLGYGTCVLATGSTPVVPSIPGAAVGGRVHVLRSLTQALALRDAAESARTAIVVGSGFLGCEAASSLARRGLDVTLVTPEDAPHAARLGADVGRRIAGWLQEDGVLLRTGTAVQRLAADGTVSTSAGELRADLVLLATGHAPDSRLAEAAGVATQDGRIVVDAAMRTGADGLLAAGDVAFAHNAAAGRHLRVEHWGEALNMGDVAGRTAAGHEASWATAPGFWSTIGERTLKQVAWGDGFDDVRVDDHGDGAFTAWYGRDGATVGVLTHGADEDYERAHATVEGGEPFPESGE